MNLLAKIGLCAVCVGAFIEAITVMSTSTPLLMCWTFGLAVVCIAGLVAVILA